MAVTAERMSAISSLISTPVRLNNKGRKIIEKNYIFIEYYSAELTGKMNTK